MKLKLVAAAVLGLAASGLAWATSPFVIKDIRVEGLQRTEPGTVFSYLPIKVGDTFTDAKASEALKSLYATGFFNDVRIESTGDVVIVAVAERPVIAQLEIKGSKEFEADQLKKALKENGLAESRIFDQGLMDGAVQELKRQYYSRGKYSVDITPHVTRLERNRIAVTIDINEGVTAKIHEIRILGGNSFKEADLLELFTLNTGDWWSWISKNDQYSKQKLTGDLEKLRAFYQNQGYLEFNIDSSQVALSPDKEAVYLVVNVNEGKKFTIGDIHFAGDLKLPEEQLRKLLKVKPGEVFNRELVNGSVTAINDRLGQDGYAFSNVNVVPDIDRSKNVAGLTFYVDPGRKTYVRKVTITGNNKTRDEVIRREMRQLEGAYYNSANVKRSKERVDLLSFFETTTVETPAVPDAPDQVDVNVNVKERSTGSISAGIGYGQGEGILLSAGISQSNLFGSGKAAALNVGTSTTTKTAKLTFTDPYYTVDGASLGYSIYRTSYDPSSTNTSSYKTTSIGSSVTLGVPVTEHDRVSYTLGVDQTRIGLLSESPQRYIDFVDRYGDTNITVTSSVGWSRDTRDSSLWPTTGYLVSVNGDLALPGGDIQFYRMSHSESWFFPLSKTYTLMLSGEAGYIAGYGKSNVVPFYQNFFVGGIGSVRGFDSSSLGPKDSNNDSLGGTRKLTATAELLFPFPGMRDSQSVRLSLFADAGTVWDPTVEGSTASSEYRYSAGVALTWLSPMGPMKFSMAMPMRTKETDKLQRFQFQLGTVF
jgi:outer membrane protein insertion porin family